MSGLLVFLLFVWSFFLLFWFYVYRQQKKLYERLIEEMRANSRHDLEQIGLPRERQSFGHDRMMYPTLKSRIMLWGLPPLPWISNHVVDLGDRFRFWGLINGAIYFGVTLVLPLALGAVSPSLTLFIVLFWICLLVWHLKQTPSWTADKRKKP